MLRQNQVLQYSERYHLLFIHMESQSCMCGDEKGDVFNGDKHEIEKKIYFFFILRSLSACFPRVIVSPMLISKSAIQ